MIASTVVVIALQAVAQLLIGRYLLDADWPSAPGAFAVVVLFGAAAFAALGVAITAFVRTSDGSSAIVNAIYLPMAFISGAFFSDRGHARLPRGDLGGAPSHAPAGADPDDLRDRRGLRGSAVAAVVVWGLFGLAVAVRRFRWEPREGVTGAEGPANRPLVPSS